MAKVRMTKVFPLVPLLRGQVLLPGVVLRVAIADRPDIAALLARIYSTSSAPRNEGPILIGCVPLVSPLLSPDGKRLLEDSGKKQAAGKDVKAIDPAMANKEDLFGYGTLAKISGVQGRVQGELALIVEGLTRFKIINITQERPYFEAQAEHYPNEGMIHSHFTRQTV
jgi:ATP-dependent Lon protease